MRWRVALLLGLTFLFSLHGAAITTYDIDVQGDTAHINVSFELYSSLDEDGEPRKINYWQASWTPPPNSEVIRLSDTQGEITDYTFTNGVIRFETNRGPRRSKEVVDLELVTQDIIDDTYNGLDLVKLQLSGFSDLRDDVPDEVTQVTVETDRRLLSASHTYEFEYDLQRYGANYRGAGPLNLHLAISDTGEYYENYVLFGTANLTEADQIFWLVPAMTGFVPEYNRYPVIVLPDDEYDQQVDSWSAGQYRSGGLIFLRESTAESDDLPAIMLHEVVHAFNEHRIRWSESGLAWFDEGVAKYVEFMVKHEKDIRQPEIFGSEVTWTGPCRDESKGRRCVYTLQPRGTPDQLWNYYESGDDWMYTWTPADQQTDEVRRFGYAYAELLMRNYIREHGADALHTVYEELRRMDGGAADDAREEAQIVLDLLGTDITPCYDAAQPSRSAFEACLDTANAMEPPVPSTVTVQNETRTIDIQPIDRPEIPDNVGDRLKQAVMKGENETWKDVILDILYEIGYGVTEFIDNLFKSE